MHLWGAVSAERVFGRYVPSARPARTRGAAKTAKTRETRLNEGASWRAKRATQASNRPRSPATSAAAPHFACGHDRLTRSMRSLTRCGHPPTTKPVRAVRWVCPTPRTTSPAQNAGNHRAAWPHRGPLRQGACARNHGPGGRRGVIVDDFVDACGGPNGSNKWHRGGFRLLPRNPRSRSRGPRYQSGVRRVLFSSCARGAAQRRADFPVQPIP